MTKLSEHTPSNELSGHTVGDNPYAHTYLRWLTAGPGRTSMASSLRTIAQYFGHTNIVTVPWAQISVEQAANLRADLQTTYTPATANKMLSGLRGVFKTVWQAEAIDGTQYQKLRDATKTINEPRLSTTRALTQTETNQLYKLLNPTPIDQRNTVLIDLCYGLGLQIMEALTLTHDAVNTDGSIKIVNSNGKERHVHCTSPIMARLAEWKQTRGDTDGPMICRMQTPSTPIPLLGIDPGTARRIIADRCTLAGIRQCTPHDLRRAHITHALADGTDLATVQRLAGHASPATTANYDQRNTHTNP